MYIHRSVLNSEINNQKQESPNGERSCYTANNTHSRKTINLLVFSFFKLHMYIMAKEIHACTGD